MREGERKRKKNSELVRLLEALVGKCYIITSKSSGLSPPKHWTDDEGLFAF